MVAPPKSHAGGTNVIGRTQRDQDKTIFKKIAFGELCVEDKPLIRSRGHGQNASLDAALKPRLQHLNKRHRPARCVSAYRRRRGW